MATSNVPERIPASLSGLTTREAIQDAIYRAITAYDRADETLLRSSAWPDIVFTLGPFGASHGIEDIVKGNWAHVSQMDTTHSLSVIRIDVVEGAKEARAALNARTMHIEKGQGLVADHKFYEVGSYYDIDLALDEKDGLWKVKRWTLTPIWGKGDPSIMTP